MLKFTTLIAVVFAFVLAAVQTKTTEKAVMAGFGDFV